MSYRRTHDVAFRARVPQEAVKVPCSVWSLAAQFDGHPKLIPQ
jgi:hypothetical protein